MTGLANCSTGFGITFRVNGTEVKQTVPAGMRLIDLLRDEFGLTAAKKACGIGRCGSCAVLFNGTPANACLLMAWQLQGSDVVTPEGLAIFPEAHAVRRGLELENAFQCGYCAPGHTVVLTALLRQNPNPSGDQIKVALAGNICRCTGYHSIIRGAMAAVRSLGQNRNVTSS